jgi:UDP-N-acetyl-D-glucosamine dehydrogenase
MNLEEKIRKRKAKVGVIGLGYVGLPLAVEFAKAGFTTLGIDVDPGRVKRINEGRSDIPDVSSKEVKVLVRNKKLRAASNYRALAGLDAVSICVPTPLCKTREPDISFVVSAGREVAKYLRRGQLIVLESTTYPGTTDELVLPLLSEKVLKVGKDFYLAFSPERVDPGNKTFSTGNITKVVGGITGKCTRMAKLLYEQVVETVVPVSSSRVAEMVKLLENTFRSTNIALANEMALVSNNLGVDIWEVVDAAATKPFGFMPFYPGPGLGGACIPIDPYYLTWKSRLMGFEARFIELAGEINRSMPEYVVSKVVDALNEHGKSVKGSSVLILGVAYKKDINDSRESPAREIINGLLGKGARVRYNDPYIARMELDGNIMKSVALSAKVLKDADCVVIVTAHSKYDFPDIVSKVKLVVDTRNATRSLRKYRRKIIKL